MDANMFGNLAKYYEDSFRFPIVTTHQNLTTNPNALSGLWHQHYYRGLYYWLYRQDIAKAKQEFYLCGRLDEYMIQEYGRKSLKDLGQSHWNATFLDSDQHFLYALLSDHQGLIQRRTRLTYPERENYIFKEKFDGSVIYDIMFSILRQDQARLNQVLPLLSNTYKAKQTAFDRLFLEGCLAGDIAKMQTGIEGVASPKLHNKRQKLSEEYGPCENTIISRAGVLYTKFAWLLGYELDIQAPLVVVAKDFWPVKPLANYDPYYGFLRVETD